jgi:diketogulonate reductase-like aldo/keto reductase
MKKFGFDYLDLYLVHWPVKGKYKETWKALEHLYKQGRVKAIGISNFLKHHIEDLLQSAEIIPMVNQMEFHPYLVQQELIDYCSQNKIQYEAWSPLGQGQILFDKTINELAVKYGKSPAQIILRCGFTERCCYNSKICKERKDNFQLSNLRFRTFARRFEFN